MFHAGAAFIDVLTTFKQECVYNALKPPSLVSVTADQFKQITDLPGETFYLETASDGSYSLKQVQPSTSSIASDTSANYTSAGATNDNSSEPKGKPAGEAHVSLNGSTVAESQTGSPSQHIKGNGSSARGDAGWEESDGSSRQKDLANV